MITIILDKWFVLDEVLPLLPKIPTREPAVLMSILGKTGLENSTRPLVFTSASGCRASENYDV